MKRDLAKLQDTTFDVVVVGGGIYGACIARDAAYRGLSVALVERGDFGCATSHNSLRTIHGGLRYLQHLDFRRIRQSIGEQNFWLRAAPHIVRPLKFVMPTYGLGTRGPVALWAGLQLYKALAYDRNSGVDANSQLPSGGIVSADSLNEAVPGLGSGDVNGGAYWYDAQMLDPDRLQIELIRDAHSKGARCANYLEATGFLRQENLISGICVHDRISDSSFQITARTTVCASGPWTNQLISQIRGPGTHHTPALMKGMNIVTRPLGPEVAFGVRSARRSDAVIGESRRMYFAAPSPGCSIVGTTHFPYDGSPDDCEFTKQDVIDFLDEFNAAYPTAQLKMDDVLYWHGGLTPAEEGDTDEVVRGHQAEIVDHEPEDGLDGVISVVGVKYTTARLVAENAVDLVYKKLGLRPPPCSARATTLPGASTDETDKRFPTYGALAPQVSGLMPEGVGEAEATFVAGCRYALQNEMAIRLDDLLLRRTDHARRGSLDAGMLGNAADLMAAHLGWDDATKQAEVDRAYTMLAKQGAPLAR